MNRGETLWMMANGDGPRDHPLLKHLNLPPLGVAGRPAPLLTKTLLFIGEGSEVVFGSAGGRSSAPTTRRPEKWSGRSSCRPARPERR